MKDSSVVSIALIGHPNCGKSSIFNYLTGLRQRVGNFPGVTVERRIGWLRSTSSSNVRIIDLPGLYSLYPTSKDDVVVHEYLLEGSGPDLVVCIIDLTHLQKQMLLLSQIKDLGIPVVVVLSMSDLRTEPEVEKIKRVLQSAFGLKTIAVSIKEQMNLKELEEMLSDPGIEMQRTQSIGYQFSDDELDVIEAVGSLFPSKSSYECLLIARFYPQLRFIAEDKKQRLKIVLDRIRYDGNSLEFEEINKRYDALGSLLRRLDRDVGAPAGQRRTGWLDQLTTHPILGPIIFFLLMFITFQVIYIWASLPMDWIESLFMWASEWVSGIPISNFLTDLLANGILAGLGGIAVFAPQIALLFLIVAIMEETGYMARVVYLFDPLMRKFGLSGRSLVAMISSGACAVPAIMSTRTIKDSKKRLNTILVAPLISCSARLPVYTVLIGLMVPPIRLGGFQAQGLVFMAVYLLSIASTLFMAWVFKFWLKTDTHQRFLIELPLYRPPLLKNVFLYTWTKVKMFLLEAGKIILLISIVIWFLSSYGPGDYKREARESLREFEYREDYDQMLSAKELEYSYIGRLGKFIEPVIAPLGYDWKIGIALLTSFVAREVFVGTMSTIYSFGEGQGELGIRDRMRAEINPATGKPLYGLPTSMSLLIFYLFAMQCMSTLAIVKKETGTWKWPLFQLVYMTFLAYFGALAVYQILS